jgi:hypothetical protein
MDVLSYGIGYAFGFIIIIGLCVLVICALLSLIMLVVKSISKSCRSLNDGQ